MSTSGLFHYNRTKCVSGDCAMAYIRNMEFCTKYGPPNGAYLPSYVQVQCKLTAHTTSLLAKCARVESTSNSIAYFRCNDDEFAILSLHSRTHTRRFASCQIIIIICFRWVCVIIVGTQFFHFTILGALQSIFDLCMCVAGPCVRGSSVRYTINTCKWMATMIDKTAPEGER